MDSHSEQFALSALKDFLTFSIFKTIISLFPASPERQRRIKTVYSLLERARAIL
jgi:hypothetical protein